MVGGVVWIVLYRSSLYAVDAAEGMVIALLDYTRCIKFQFERARPVYGWIQY